MYKLSQTKFYANHKAQCDAIATYFAGIYFSDELDNKFAVADSKYAKNWLSDAQYDAIAAEYDKLDEIVIAGTIADVDEEGAIFDIDGEEIIEDECD